MVTKKYSKTENGDRSLPTTGNGLTNLFFTLGRDTSPDELRDLVKAAFHENPLQTLKVIFHARDCRGGQGDRKTAQVALGIVYEIAPEWFMANAVHMPFFGRYLDWFEALAEFVEGADRVAIVAMVCDQLKKDKACMDAGGPVSLLAKWIPSEGKKLGKVLGEVCRCMFPEGGKKKVLLGRLRKEYVSPLRKYIEIVESLMCAKEWDKIKFARVPSVAMNDLKKVFDRNAKESFAKYIEALAEGKAKVNSSQVDPHELVEQYMDAYTSTIRRDADPVIEAQWAGIVKRTMSMGSLGRTLVLSDVSGSMAGIPMLVSIALGILISGLATGPYRDKIITFHETPTFHSIPESAKTLLDKVRNVASMPWGGSTNLCKAFDLILGIAKENRLPPDQAPERLLILSDMQFDEACKSNNTQFVRIQEAFEASGYTMPSIVFWNLRRDTPKDFPVSYDQAGVALVSGYRTSILKQILSGVELTPYNIMLQAINDPRYDRIVAPAP